MNTLKRITTVWLCCFVAVVAFGQTHIKFDLAAPFFNANPASNRVVTLQPLSPFPGNLITYTSSAAGIFYHSNAYVTDYSGLIKAKGQAGEIKFQVSVSATNWGVVNADGITSVLGQQSYPTSGKSSWSIQASDQRYVLSPTNASTATDGQVVSKTGNRTKYIDAGTGSSATNVFFYPGQNSTWRTSGGSNVVDVTGILTNRIANLASNFLGTITTPTNGGSAHLGGLLTVFGNVDFGGDLTVPSVAADQGFHGSDSTLTNTIDYYSSDTDHSIIARDATGATDLLRYSVGYDTLVAPYGLVATNNLFKETTFYGSSTFNGNGIDANFLTVSSGVAHFNGGADATDFTFSGDLVFPAAFQNKIVGVNGSGLAVPAALSGATFDGTTLTITGGGGSGIGVTNGTGTNTTLYTADNSPDATGAPALKLVPLDKLTVPGGAARIVEIQPPYTNTGFTGVFRESVSVATNTLGDLRQDIVWNKGYNFAPGGGTPGTIAGVDTNESSWIEQRESRWQNQQGLSQLEIWDYFATPYTAFGTNYGTRFFGATLVWDTTNKMFVSCEGNIQLQSFEFINPRSVGTAGIVLQANGATSTSFTEILRGTLITETNDTGLGGITVKGGVVTIGRPDTVSGPAMALKTDWNDQLGVNSQMAIYPSASGTELYLGLPAVAGNNFTNVVASSNFTVRGDAKIQHGLTVSNIAASSIIGTTAAKAQTNITIGTGLSFDGVTLTATGGAGGGIATNSGSGYNNVLTNLVATTNGSSALSVALSVRGNSDFNNSRITNVAAIHTSGDIDIQAIGTAKNITVSAGDGTTSTGSGGNITFAAGDAGNSGGDAGAITLQGGIAGDPASANKGNINLFPGYRDGTPASFGTNVIGKDYGFGKTINHLIGTNVFWDRTVMSNLTASQFVATDAAKGLVSTVDGNSLTNLNGTSPNIFAGGNLNIANLNATNMVGNAQGLTNFLYVPNTTTLFNTNAAILTNCINYLVVTNNVRFTNWAAIAVSGQWFQVAMTNSTGVNYYIDVPTNGFTRALTNSTGSYVVADASGTNFACLLTNGQRAILSGKFVGGNLNAGYFHFKHW